MQLVEPDPYSIEPLEEGLTYFRATDPDYEQAVYWFRVAADSGNTEGLAMFALCQLEGLGLPRDPAQARGRLERAASEGSLTARFNLGRALVAGWGGAPDAARGVALYTAAAELGHADATFNLASCLDAGWGCQPDRLAAKALFMRARALGSPLRAPGVRVRQRELAALRELVRRFEHGSQLSRVIEERQHEITLMHDLVHNPPRKRGLNAVQRRRLLRVASFAALVSGLAAALVRWVAWRSGHALADDGQPTSVV